MVRQKRLTFPLSDRDRCERGSLPQDAHSGRDGEKTQRGRGGSLVPRLAVPAPMWNQTWGEGCGSPASLRTLRGCAVLPTVLLSSSERTSETEVPHVGAKGREAFEPRPKKGTADTPEWPAWDLLALAPQGLL